VVGPAGRPDYDQQHCYHQAPTVNQRLLLQSLYLLMMGMRMPETCWAVFELQVINLRSCCICLVDSVESMMMHRLANPKVLGVSGTFRHSPKSLKTSIFCITALRMSSPAKIPEFGLFINGLFNDAVSSSDYNGSNCGRIREWRICRNLSRKQS